MDYKSYITRKQACFQTESGPVNIPAGTVLTAKEGIVYGPGGEILCDSTSQQALDVLRQNDDGRGLERGVLVEAINARLKEEEIWMGRNKVIDLIWEDDLCQSYRRLDIQSSWIWKSKFYNAPLEDLLYIARLMGVKFASSLEQ